MALTTTALHLEPLGYGRHRISVHSAPGVYVPRAPWDTSYPPELIREIHAVKGSYVCDEIRREEDPAYVEHHIRHEILSYVAPSAFGGKRILDFGCGSGASSMVLARLLPPCEIVGVELEERLLRIARWRARHLGRADVRFIASPSPGSLPEGLGTFDFVIFSAVFEHLLPNERPAILGLIWRHMKRGAVLFLTETPHRFAPVEMHTTNLPLINYLPDALTRWAATRFSRQVDRTATWDQLLRAGIRGGSVREISAILAASGRPTILDPLAGRDRIDVWFGKLSGRYGLLKRLFRVGAKIMKWCTGIQFTPWLALAIRKDG